MELSAAAANENPRPEVPEAAGFELGAAAPNKKAGAEPGGTAGFELGAVAPNETPGFELPEAAGFELAAVAPNEKAASEPVGAAGFELGAVAPNGDPAAKLLAPNPGVVDPNGALDSRGGFCSQEGVAAAGLLRAVEAAGAALEMLPKLNVEPVFPGKPTSIIQGLLRLHAARLIIFVDNASPYFQIWHSGQVIDKDFARQIRE